MLDYYSVLALHVYGFKNKTAGFTLNDFYRYKMISSLDKSVLRGQTFLNTVTNIL